MAKKSKKPSGYWWRAYNDSLDDPKVQMLPDRLFKAWYNVCCVSAKNDGKPFPISAVAFGLRVSIVEASAVVRDLVRAGLIDQFPNDLFLSHNWKKRQYKTDQIDPTNNDRKTRHRDKKRSNEATDGVEDGTVNSVPNSVPNTVPLATVPEHTDQIQIRSDKSTAGGQGQEREAIRVVQKLAEICGFINATYWPPGWLRGREDVERWLLSGWTAEFILRECEISLKFKTDGPPDSLRYFDKMLARAYARRAVPLPVVKTIEGSTIHVPLHQPTGRRSGVAEALDRAKRHRANETAASGQHSEGEPIAGGGSGGDDPIRLLPG